MREPMADIAEHLPSDPTELLDAGEHRQLNADLVAMAKLRRDAETDSGGLRVGGSP